MEKDFVELTLSETTYGAKGLWFCSREIGAKNTSKYRSEISVSNLINESQI